MYLATNNHVTYCSLLYCAAFTTYASTNIISPGYEKFTLNEDIEYNVNTNSLFCWCGHTHKNIAQKS